MTLTNSKKVMGGVFLATLGGLSLLSGEPTAITLNEQLTPEASVEIKESLSGQPEIVMDKWHEASMTLSVPQVNDEQAEQTGQTLTWEDSLIKTDFYTLPSKENMEDGGLEFEYIWKSQPASGIVSFPIETSHLVFYYQPPLTDEYTVGEDFQGQKITSVSETEMFTDQGQMIYRPENVVGSYAVYHDSKVNGMYKTGKAFNIFRPKMIDAKGNEAWCNLTIDQGFLRVSCDEEWLASATYPVVLDPTLGYTTIGGTSVQLNASFVWGAGDSSTLGYAMPEDGTAIDVQWYMQSSSVSHGATFGIYAQGSGVPGSLVTNSAEITITTTLGWFVATLSGSLTSGSTYYPAANSAGTNSYRYDTVTNAGKFVASTYSAGTLANPYPSSPTNFSSRLSTYIDYTASGGVSPKALNNTILFE